MRKEIPILFSTDMVLALLAGRKTQTRRELNPRTPEATALMVNLNAGIRIEETKAELIRCFNPYGEPGDWLWVREAFMEFGDPEGVEERVVYYRANFRPDSGMITKWKPSIHLKKTKSRIWLEITDVSVEQLFDISEVDAIAEGVECWPSKQIPGYTEYRDYLHKGADYKDWGKIELTARNSFISLWEHINGNKSVNANPWVWVVKFKILSTTGKPESN